MVGVGGIERLCGVGGIEWLCGWVGSTSDSLGDGIRTGDG